MAIQSLSPSSLYWPVRTAPQVLQYSGTSLFGTVGLINDATDDAHMVGTLQWADGGSNKTVAEITVYFSAVSSPVMDLRASIQGVAAPTGSAARMGDGTIEVSEIDTSPTAIGEYTFVIGTPAGSFSTGELIAVVIDVNAFTSGSITLGGLTTAGGTICDPCCSFNNAGISQIPNVLLKAGDGTYGILRGSTFIPGLTVVNYGTGSTYDERGNLFTPPFKCRVIGVWFRGYAEARATSTLDATIYSAPTTSPSVVASATGDANELWQVTNAASGIGQLFFASPVTLDAATQYCVALKATGTTTINIEEVDLVTAARGVVLSGGTGVYEVRRDGGTGAFTTESTAKFLQVGLIIDGLDDGAGGSVSGMIVHPGMAGGMRA